MINVLVIARTIVDARNLQRALGLDCITPVKDIRDLRGVLGALIVCMHGWRSRDDADDLAREIIAIRIRDGRSQVVDINLEALEQ